MKECLKIYHTDCELKRSERACINCGYRPGFTNCYDVLVGRNGYRHKCIKPYKYGQGFIGILLMCCFWVPLIGWILGFVGCCMTFTQ